MDGSIKPAGRQAELFNDHIFRELRAYAQVPDDFIDTGWSLTDLEKGGGKGGTLMARVGSSYIVKELSAGDHKTLLQITASYAQHVRSGDTLLCPIYVHFRDVSSGRTFFGMRNGIGAGPFKALYDLKGCADDKTIEKDGRPIAAVHKRIWNVGMWCGKAAWSDERRRYFAGKLTARNVDISVTPEQKEAFLHCLRRDTQWLSSQRIMDYSLLVAIKEGVASSASGGSSPSSLSHRPLVQRGPDGCDIAVHICIIDFLQKWTMGKRVARVLKFAECNKATVPPTIYAERFLRHFELHFVPTAAVKVVPPHHAKLVSVAPPAGDCEAEGKPEERLNSRPIAEIDGV